MVNTELKFSMFILRSELYSEFYHEMGNKCHDQNSGRRRNHNEIFNDSVLKYYETQILCSYL